MNITVNGKPVQVRDDSTVLELLEELKVKTPEYVSVELNGEILDRAGFADTTVKEGDIVEFLYYMGGGWR